MCTSVRKWWNWLELVDLLLFSPRHPRCVGDKDNNNWQIAPLIYQSGRNRVLTNTPLNRAASYVIVQKASNTRCHRASGLFVRSGAFLRPILHCQRKYAYWWTRGERREGQSPPPLVAAIWPDIPRIKYVLWLAHRTVALEELTRR